MFRHLPAATLALIAATALNGCYSPSGGIMPHTGAATTYYSNEHTQKTITVVDTRTNEVVFFIEVPPGKQLTIDFDKGEGDDPVSRPDLMTYEVMDKGTRIGTLDNSLSVPNAACRRVDVSLRSNVEYAEGSAQRSLRTDELADRPDWWTPEGGPRPADKKTQLYD